MKETLTKRVQRIEWCSYRPRVRNQAKSKEEISKEEANGKEAKLLCNDGKV